MTVDKEKIDFDFTIASIAVAQCAEHIAQYENLHERADHHETIERTLEIIQDQFYLTPKVIDHDGTLITRAAPAEAITEPLYELWNSVSI